MRVAFVSATKPMPGSGTGTIEYTYNLYLALKKLGVGIDFYYALEESKRVNVIGIPYATRIFPGKIKGIANMGYDIIHVTDPEVGSVVKLIKKVNGEARVVTMIHDLIRFQRGVHRGIIQAAYGPFVRRSIGDAVRNSDALIFNSTQTEKEVEEKFGKIKEGKVIPLGIKEEFLKTEVKRKERRGKEFTVGYIGSLGHHKNVLLLLRAAKLLNAEHNIKFMVWGTGEDWGLLHTYKADNNLQNVHFMGFAPEKEKRRLLESFDVFVFPSIHEGFAITVLEAQSRGIPTIIYSRGKIPPEVARYAFKADSAEGIAELIKKMERAYPDRARKLALSYARRFTWEKAAQETLALYKKVRSA